MRGEQLGNATNLGELKVNGNPSQLLKSTDIAGSLKFAHLLKIYSVLSLEQRMGERLQLDRTRQHFLSDEDEGLTFENQDCCVLELG